MNVLFTGPGVITSATEYGDMSADSVRTAVLPLFANFGIFNNIELRILRRSNPGLGAKGGAGEVQLVFGHQVRLPKTVHLLNPGRIKRIRGVAYCTGVSASNNARCIEAARGILNPMTGDTYIYSDVTSAPFVPTQGKLETAPKRKTGIGFGLSLVAESTTGCLYSADVASPAAGGVPPEDLGQACAYQLLESVARSGCISLEAAPLMLILMAMGSEDVGRIRVGKEILASEQLIQLGRDLKAFGNNGWGIREANADDSDDFIISMVGRGLGNVGRKIA